MAAFCTKCGAGLTPDTKFCTKCGSPTAATPAAGPVTGGAAQWGAPPAPPAPPAAPPPQAQWSTPAASPSPQAAAQWSTPSAPPSDPQPAGSEFQPVSAPPPVFSGFQPVGVPTPHAAPGFQPVSAPPPPPPPPPAPSSAAYSAPVPPPARPSFAPVAAPPSTFAPVAAPSSTPPPYSGSPYPAAAQPPQKSGGALKIILIIVGVLVLLVVLVIAGLGFAAWRISRSIHISGSGENGQVSIHTDQGNITAKGDEGLSASELGVALYPGSSVARGGMKMDLPTGTMATGVYTTSDSKDQVVAFYKSKLGSGLSTFDTANGAVLSQKVSDRETIVITVEGNSSEFEGKTKYSISHTTAAKP